MFVAVFAVSLALRVQGPRAIGPYDEAYHWKRIAAFPHVIQFDPDREAWCPWPPRFDWMMWGTGTLACPANDRQECRSSPFTWIPPIAFSVFAALPAVAIQPLGIATA